MNFIEYRKEINVTMNDRDFYGFATTEGEVWVENQTLHIKVRHNNPMSNEKGEYTHNTYEILEYFDENKYLKVKHGDFVHIFDLHTAEFCPFNSSLIIETAQLDLQNSENQSQLQDFILYVLSYLYRLDEIDSEKIKALLSAQWENKEILFNELPRGISMKQHHFNGIWYNFHQVKNIHFLLVSYSLGMPVNRLVFSFCTGYFTADLTNRFKQLLSNYPNWRVII